MASRPWQRGVEVDLANLDIEFLDADTLNIEENPSQDASPA